MIIKKAQKEHTQTLAEFRYRMFDEMYPDEKFHKRKAEIIKKSTQYFLTHLDDADHYSVIVCSANQIIGCGTLLLQEKPPNPRYEKNITGYILNIYVDTEYRRKGVATRIIKHFHEYMRRMGISRAALHASKSGYEVYTKIGYNRSESYLEKDI